MTISIKRTASDKRHGLTVAELEVFKLDIDHAGLHSDTRVKATVGFKGQITSIEAAG